MARFRPDETAAAEAELNRQNNRDGCEKVHFALLFFLFEVIYSILESRHIVTKAQIFFNFAIRLVDTKLKWNLLQLIIQKNIAT